MAAEQLGSGSWTRALLNPGFTFRSSEELKNMPIHGLYPSADELEKLEVGPEHQYF